MTFFEELMGKIFPEKNGGDKILSQEVINRPKEYQVRYENWKAKRLEGHLRSVEKAYQGKLIGEDVQELNVHILSSKYANGIAITYHSKLFDKDEFSFLFDWFSEKTSELPYRLVNSDRRVMAKNNFVETKEKHYLKPSISENDELVNQLFGNILIEHILVNEEPSYLKITANVYSDSKYLPPQKFEKYLEKVFN